MSDRIFVLLGLNKVVEIDTPEGPFTRDEQGNWRKELLNGVEGMDLNYDSSPEKQKEAVQSLLDSGLSISAETKVLLRQFIKDI